MKGLIIKDALVAKQQAPVYFFLAAIWFAVSLINGSVAFFSGVMTMFIIMIPMNSFSYDEKAKWDKYALTMPLKRETVVLSKYVLSFIVAAVVFVISCVASAIDSGNILESLSVSAASVFVGIAVISVMFPLFFKFGIEKGRIMIFVVAFIPAAIIFLAEKMDFSLPADFSIQNTAVLAVAAVIVLLAASIMISNHIYKNKEID